MTIPVQRSPVWAALLAVAVLTASAPATAQDTRQPAKLPAPRPSNTIDAPKLKYTDFTLPNGLRVVLHEDHSSPIVAIDLWYNIGAKNDPPNRQGLAHLFEHMLDEGTANMPAGGFKRTVQSAGGFYNAYTNDDWTHYLMVMPSTHLETALWLEAERMVNFKPDTARFNMERQAVRNEYRGTMASNIGTMLSLLKETLFEGGAYASATGGTETSLDSATISDLLKVYDQYYVPNNAVLSIVGDFRTADARRLVTKHLGRIPRGKPVVKTNAAPPMKPGERRLVVEHRANLRQVWIAWRGAKAAGPDRPALLALAGILNDRLRRVLAEERRIAIPPGPSLNTNFDLEEAGVFQVVITLSGPAAKAESATEAEQVVDSVIAAIKTNGVTPTELQRWRSRYSAQMLIAMQADSAKASLIGDGTLNMNMPMGNIDIVERVQRLTPAEVQSAARKYLTGDRVVASLVPPGRIELRSKPDLPYTNATRKTP